MLCCWFVYTCLHISLCGCIGILLWWKFPRLSLCCPYWNQFCIHVLLIFRAICSLYPLRQMFFIFIQFELMWWNVPYFWFASFFNCVWMVILEVFVTSVCNDKTRSAEPIHAALNQFISCWITYYVPVRFLFFTSMHGFRPLYFSFSWLLSLARWRSW